MRWNDNGGDGRKSRRNSLHPFFDRQKPIDGPSYLSLFPMDVRIAETSERKQNRPIDRINQIKYSYTNYTFISLCRQFGIQMVYFITLFKDLRHSCARCAHMHNIIFVVAVSVSFFSHFVPFGIHILLVLRAGCVCRCGVFAFILLECSGLFGTYFIFMQIFPLLYRK